jgi:kynureninase
MEPTFRPTPGAKGYQHSCTPVFSSIPLLATLQLIDKAGFDAMREKGIRLTNTLESLLQSSRFYIPPGTATSPTVGFKILTPPAPWRGTQLSLFIVGSEGVMPRVFSRCIAQGLVGDERHPSVIRLSPVVLYNTFEEVGRAVGILEKALEDGPGCVGVGRGVARWASVEPEGEGTSRVLSSGSDTSGAGPSR